MDKIFDIVVIIVIIGCILKYFQISKICKKGRKKDSKLSLSGCEVAQKLIDNNNLGSMYVVQTTNPLYEKYDSSRKVIRLSKRVFNGTTFTDVLIASREVGYAILDSQNNFIYKIKDIVMMPLNILTYISYIVIIASAFLRDFKFLKIGLLSLLVIIIIHACFYKFDKTNMDNVVKLLKENKMFDDEEEPLVNDLVKELCFTYIVYPIHLIVILFDKLKRQND